MRAYEKLLVAAATALPLAGAFFAAPLIQPDTGDLNRNPMPFPEVRASDFLSADAYSAVTSWLRDRVPLRRMVRKVDVKIDRGLFHDIDDAMILQGLDGWMFFEPEIGLGLLPDHEPESLRTAILRLKSEVESAGKRFLFVYAPHKATIYPQYLNDRDRRRQAEVRERLEQFRDLMRREPVEGFIDAWDEMEAAARTAPEPLYYPRDTHWTSLGAVEVTRKVVSTLSPGIDATLRIGRDEPRQYIPDLVKYAGLEQSETINVWTFERPGVTVAKAGVEKAAHTRTRQFKATAERGVPLLPKIVVICDSYGTALHPSLKLFFRTTTAVHIDATDTKLARRALAQADIVMFLRVERFMWLTSGEAPFAHDTETVQRFLSTLRLQSKAPPGRGLTERSAATSGSVATSLAAATRRWEGRIASPPPKIEETR